MMKFRSSLSLIAPLLSVLLGAGPALAEDAPLPGSIAAPVAGAGEPSGAAQRNREQFREQRQVGADAQGQQVRQRIRAQKRMEIQRSPRYGYGAPGSGARMGGAGGRR